MQMRYISTRGDATSKDAKPFCDILLEGLAPDGGLAVPQSYPQLGASDLKRLRTLGYRDLAFEILSLYIDDIPAADLRAIVDRTYTRTAFRSEDITPLKVLEPGLALLQLSNGPTLAFKNVAASRSTSWGPHRGTPGRRPSTPCAARRTCACSCCHRTAR